METDDARRKIGRYRLSEDPCGAAEDVLIFYKRYHIHQTKRGRYEVWMNFVELEPVVVSSLNTARVHINIVLELQWK